MLKIVTRYFLIISICVVVAGIFALSLNYLNVNLFGFQQAVALRTWFVIAMFFYLAAVLLSIGGKTEVPLIVAIPFLTQFYQVSLGRETLEGATSLLRLGPLIVMGIAMVASIILRNYRPKSTELACLSAFLIIGLIALVNSASMTPIGFTCLFLVGFLIPLFYVYCGSLEEGTKEDIRVLLFSVSIGCFILIIGSIGTFRMALGIDIAEGAGTYRGTQNVVDINSIYSYLLLTWPLTFLYMKKYRPELVIPLILLTIVIVMISFSRTAFLLTPLIILFSLMTYSFRNATKTILVLFVAVVLFYGLFARGFNLDEISSSWGQRFNITELSFGQIRPTNLIEPIKPGSGSYLNRKEIWAEAVRLFYERPLFGNGWGSFQELSRVEHTTAHNITLGFLVETGMVGAIAFWFLVYKIVMILEGFYFKRVLSRKMIVMIFAIFLIWLIVGHTMGSSLYLASRTGFQVNAITGFMFVLLLRRNIIEFIVQKDLPPDQL